MNKRIVSFVLSNLHLISLFNKIQEFSFENDVFEVTVEGSNGKDMEWEHFKKSVRDEDEIIKEFKTVKNGDYFTAVVIFKSSQVHKKKKVKDKSKRELAE